MSRAMSTVAWICAGRWQPLGACLGRCVGESNASSLGSSLRILSSLLFSLSLLICLGLPFSRFSLTSCVHDHLWRLDVGAFSLRDRNRAAGARAAIGSAAITTGQV
jgi:hypothetical protein